MADSSASDLGAGAADRDERDDLDPVAAAVLTISAERTLDDDPAGDAVVEELDAAGHEVVTRNLVRRDYDGVQSEVNALVRRDDVEAVVTTGGTGVEPADVTVEAVRPLFDKPMPGFGELFRSLCHERVGTRVVATRALAGIANGVPVFCLPGDEATARKGAGAIVGPELGPIARAAKPDAVDEAEPGEEPTDRSD